jgi:hypothetical protein
MNTPNEPSDHDAGTILPQKAIDDLKAIYRRKCGSDLSDHDAREMSNRLLRVFAVLTREPTDRRDRV